MSEVNGPNFSINKVNFKSQKQVPESPQGTTEEEPKFNFKLSEFTILKKIGEGAEGSIFTVKWKKNNKIYVLKKSEVIFEQITKKKKEVNKLLKDFVEITGSDGVIKIYGNLVVNNEFGTQYFYELMELGGKTWEKEIEIREKRNYTTMNMN